MANDMFANQFPLAMSMGDSVFAIATAFRGASEEDTREVLNAISDASKACNLKFFMVPCSWMSSCLPFLRGKTEDRPTMKIINTELLASGSVSDDEEKEQLSGSNPQDHDSKTLRRGIEHEQDYFLVGSRVWILISSKFGFDVELAFHVVPQTNRTLSVDIGIQKVDIPPTGHFCYEQKKPGIVSEEEELGDDLRNCKSEPPSESRAIIVVPTSNSTRDQTIRGDDSLLRLHDSEPSIKKRKRYGSGLANLGNTCFLNSTLQCLAHTEPLRRYFISGEYEKDLNRHNPLGTGGELATSFAKLLTEMFTTTLSYAFQSSVVYPRSFKVTLGKHAAQFMGYDQHDSQEFATYLLDALHEDCNRVTKKPYIEKPEQAEDEADDEAADKAWRLHLRREDSKVLEQFMGQVKSKVQCPRPGCGRVSTTFDPFMYLSVPIPGAADRQLKVTFVPLEGAMRNMVVTLPKTTNIATLLSKVSEQVGKDRDVENFHAIDVWNKEVYLTYNLKDEIHRIRDIDATYIFHLKQTNEVATSSTSTLDESDSEQVESLIPSGAKERATILPMDTSSSLFKTGVDENGKSWTILIESFIVRDQLRARLLNRNQGTIDERLEFHQRLDMFLNKLYLTAEVQALGMCSNEEDKKDDEDDQNPVAAMEVLTIQDVVSKSGTFKHVSTVSDVRKLAIVEMKFRDWIMDWRTILEKQERERNDEGFVLNISLQEKGRSGTYQTFARPLCIRVPASLTVYDLRMELAKMLPFKFPRTSSESIGSSDTEDKHEGAHVDAADTNVVPLTDDRSTGEYVGDVNSPELVMRLLPMSGSHKGQALTSSISSRSIGMIEKSSDFDLGRRPVSLASDNEPLERQRVIDVVGHQRTVFVHWTQELRETFFDLDAFMREEQETSKQPADGRRTRRSIKPISVTACIEKYCQMEQLEDSEKWYCNKCREHVRAWKQFDLYRTPPILIIHLKRFHFSASTHRRDKIDSYIDFPLEGLDLSGEVMRWCEDEKPVYDCYAVSNHYGGLGAGHYTAYAMSDDGVWCYFDDSKVSTDVDPKEVISNAAYVLYYRRRDVVFDGSDLDFPLPKLAHNQNGSKERFAGRDLVADSMEVDEKDTSRSSTSPMGSVTNQDDDASIEPPNCDRNSDITAQ